MDNALTQRASTVGHLTLTTPAIGAIFLVPYFGLRMFGPFLLIYYVIAGVALGWQWYLVALPSWKTWLMRTGMGKAEVDTLAHSSGLEWPVDSSIGPFALHTVASAFCGIHLGPWLLSRWYVLIVPLLGISSHNPTGDDWLQHFELASTIAALVAGYLLSRYFERWAEYAWVLPTIILIYKLFAFTDPQASAIAPHSWVRWEYFFVIQRTMPTFTPGFGGVDPIRVADQVFVLAPFYAGLAYSAGAFAATHDFFEKIFGSSSIQPETAVSEAEGHVEGCSQGKSGEVAQGRD